MPHKKAKANKKKPVEYDLPVEPSKQADDTPKAFARLFRYKEIAEQKRKEKEGAKNNNQEQKPGIAKRREGERFKDFTRRIEREYRTQVVEAIKEAKPVSERRKRRREARKLKEQAKKQRELEQYGGRDFDDLKDEIKFGEVASAPPTLTKIPKARGRGKQLLEEKTKQAMQDTSEQDENLKQLKASHKRKLQNMSASARKALEQERERAIELYRAKKARKMIESGLTPL